MKADRQPDSVEEMLETGTTAETTEATPRVGPTLTQAEMEAVMKKVGSFNVSDEESGVLVMRQ